MATVIVATSGDRIRVGAPRPVIAQTGASLLRFQFPYAPVSISFDSVGSDYAEIPRPGDFPLIDRRGPTLLRASFEFRVADRSSYGLVSVDDTLRTLRRMAYEDSPVVFSGMAGFLIADDPALIGEASAMLFRIVDLGITVVRLTSDGKPSQVDVRMTVSEDRNPTVKVVTLPRITYVETPPVATKAAPRKPTGKKKPSTIVAWTDYSEVYGVRNYKELSKQRGASTPSGTPASTFEKRFTP